MATTSAKNMTAASRKRRNPYTNVACQECKRRKVKCSGENPCAGCQQVQANCLYERSTRFRTGRRTSMVSTNSKDDTHALEGRADGAVSLASHEEAPISLEPDQSPQPIRPGSSDYYLNLAQQLLVGSTPEDGRNHGTNSQSPGMAQDLRKLIQDRSNHGLQPLLSIIALPRWLEILDTYEEEIGLLYPFLDVTDIRNQLRDSSSYLPGVEVTRKEIRFNHKLEEILILVLTVMAVLEEPDVSGMGDEFAEQLMTSTWRRSHTGTVTDHDVTLSILMSIYYFMTDREPLAWRNIGGVVRMLQELGYNSSVDLQHRFKSRAPREKAKKTLWSAYMLDRRWSFGTGLPFAIQDSDIDFDSDFMDDSLSSAYLKAMVSYCRIAAEVRDSALAMPSPNHAKDSARDLLDFKIGEWRRNLPQCLHFHPGMEFDPLEGTRGQYRLRLLLYLRANQMRIVIHRKSALRSGNNTIDTSSINAMVDVAQDTVRVLVKLTQASNIYHAQQKTFNHFLESALSALLLVTCRSKVMTDRSYASDVHLALGVIERLSTSSSITRKLAEKLRCFTTHTSESIHPSGKSDIVASFEWSSSKNGRGGDQPREACTSKTFRRPSSISADQISSNINQAQGNRLDQVVVSLETGQGHNPTGQSFDQVQPNYLIPTQHGLADSTQIASLDQVTIGAAPSLLYSLGSAPLDNSPNSMPTDPTIVDLTNGLDVPMGEKWDELLSDLGDFWVDYDRMITF